MKAKLRRRLTYSFSALLTAAAALLLIVPTFVDAPAVRAEIQRRLGAALGGQVTWRVLEVRLLPVPYGELQQVRIEIPGSLSADAERVDVHLRLWPLLRGRPEVASVTLRKPQIRIGVAGGRDAEAPGDALAAYRAVAGPIARALREFAPETTLQLSGAEFAGPFSLRAVDAIVRSGATGLEFQAVAGHHLWRRLRIEGRVDYADLSAKLTALVEDLDVAATTALAGLRADSGTFDGRVTANASVQLDTSWRADVEVVRSSAAYRLAQLPGPVRLAAGSAHVDAAAVRLDQVAVTMLDANARVSGSVALAEPQVELTADGAAGEALVRWALERAGAPARLEPTTPLRFAAQRIAWAPQSGVAVDTRIDVVNGPRLAVVVQWTPERLELRRVAIKDARSDATLTAVVGQDLLQAGFSGVLYGSSVAALQRRPESRSGSVQGELHLAFDRARGGRTTGEGNLRIEALDLTWLAGRRTLIEHAELTADRSSLRIPRARLVVEEQVLELSGEGRHTDQGPVIDARLDSPGIVVERLLPPAGKPASGSPESNLWPLPVTGRIAVRAGFLQQGKHRIEPFEGSAVLEPGRARLELQAAKMCGVSFPLQLEATPERYAVTAQITMQNTPFAHAIRCLTGDTVQITGHADLSAELRTQGKRGELLRNLAGTARAELRGGRVERFALIGNILSLRNIASVREMRERGFPYRRMTAHGRFEDGAFVVEEGFFDSDAARLAVNGKVDLVGDHTQLTVLVGLLTTVDRVTGAIPLIGDVFGKSLTALPVSVTGDIRDPLVVPLDPRAITDRLLGVFERALKLPGKLVVPPAGTGGSEPASPGAR